MERGLLLSDGSLFHRTTPISLSLSLSLSLSHLGRYRPIGVLIEHVEGLLERLQLVLPQLLVDVEGCCGGMRKK